MKPFVSLLIIACTLLSACADKTDSQETSQEQQPAHHGQEGPNGGALIELGAHVAHMEILHDHDAQSVTLYAYDGNLKPITLDKAPMLNFVSDEGPKQITGVAAADSNSSWVFKDKAFQGDPGSARFRIVLKGVTYSPDLPHDH